MFNSITKTFRTEATRVYRKVHTLSPLWARKAYCWFAAHLELSFFLFYNLIRLGFVGFEWLSILDVNGKAAATASLCGGEKIRAPIRLMQTSKGTSV